MVKVQDQIKLRKDGRTIDATALFDTGSGASYLSEEKAESIGYERYPEPRKVALAVKDTEAEIVGYVPAVDIEITGYLLPLKETLNVIKDLRAEAIVGLDIIEKYSIVFERDTIRFKEYPPRTFLF